MQMIAYIPATIGLIAVNVLVFILIKTKKCHAMNLGMSADYTLEDKQYYRIVTGAFTHEDPLHILCNLMSMYNMGVVLEPALGTTRFIVYYAVILMVGGYISCMWHKKTSPRVVCIGASGTICGLLGIYMVLLFRIYGMDGIRSVYPTIGMLVLMTFSKKIDSIGHFSGLFVGVICGILICGLRL